MNSLHTTESTITADPDTLQHQVDEIESTLSKAADDEREVEADVVRLEAESQQAATDAYLAGRPIPATKELDAARGRLRAIRGARVQLMVRRDSLEAERQGAQIDSLIANANRLNAERHRDYEIALALQAISARLFARSLGDLCGGYPLHGRIGRNGIVAPSDADAGNYLPELNRVSMELRSLGFAEAEAICKARPTSIPGGEQLRGSPVVARVRELAHRIETGLVAGELLPSTYPTINPDVPTNID